MSVITNKWNDESGDSISIESPSFQGNQTVKISSPVQKGTSKKGIILADIFGNKNASTNGMNTGV